MRFLKRAFIAAFFFARGERKNVKRKMHCAARCPPPPPRKKKAPDGRWLPGAVRSVTAHAPRCLHSYTALPGSSSPASPGRPG